MIRWIIFAFASVLVSESSFVFWLHHKNANQHWVVVDDEPQPYLRLSAASTKQYPLAARQIWGWLPDGMFGIDQAGRVVGFTVHGQRLYDARVSADHFEWSENPDWIYASGGVPNLVRVTDGFVVRSDYADWSADGRWMIYDNLILERNSRQSRPFVNRTAWHPQFTHDDQWIVAATSYDQPTIFRVRPSGEDFTELATLAGRLAPFFNLMISPNDQWAAAITNLEGWFFQLYSINLESGHYIPLGDFFQTPVSVLPKASFSSDGEWLTLAYTDSSGFDKQYLLSPDGRVKRFVSDRLVSMQGQSGFHHPKELPAPAPLGNPMQGWSILLGLVLMTYAILIPRARQLV